MPPQQDNAIFVRVWTGARSLLAAEIAVRIKCRLAIHPTVAPLLAGLQPSEWEMGSASSAKVKMPSGGNSEIGMREAGKISDQLCDRRAVRQDWRGPAEMIVEVRVERNAEETIPGRQHIARP